MFGDAKVEIDFVIGIRYKSLWRVGDRPRFNQVGERKLYSILLQSTASSSKVRSHKK